MHSQAMLARTLEGGCKALVLLLLGALFLPMVAGVGAMGFAGAGWSIGLPTLMGWLLWDASGMWTRRESTVNYRIFLPALPVGLLGLVYIDLVIGLGTSPMKPWMVMTGYGSLAIAVAITALRFGQLTRRFRFSKPRRSSPAWRLRPDLAPDERRLGSGE